MTRPTQSSTLDSPTHALFHDGMLQACLVCGMLRIHHLAGRASKLVEKIGKSMSALCQGKKQECHNDPKLDSLDKDKCDADGLEEATRVVVMHSRLAWSPEHGAGPHQNETKAQSTLDPSLQRFLSRNKSCCGFCCSDNSSRSVLSTRLQSPSPSVGHSRGLERRKQNYAHEAWTPPDEVFDLDLEEERRRSESFLKHLRERCEERACYGEFDEDVIKCHFESSYRLRTTPYEQFLASVDFREQVEVKAEKRRLEFEQLHKQEEAVAPPTRSTVASKAGRDGIDFDSGFRSVLDSLGDIVGEVMGRSGGVGFI